MLASAIGVLREIDARLYLPKRLCLRGSADLRRGDRAAARVALDEAERITNEVGAAPASDLRQRIAALRSALEGS